MSVYIKQFLEEIIAWLKERHPSWVILCLEVKESCSLYVYI